MHEPFSVQNAAMSHTEILESARKLPPVERLHLIDALLESLDEPDPVIEAAWLAEAQDRLAAFERGELPLADMMPVLEKYR
jgi:putative addiction module component (TIGR02574 family)